MQRNGITPLGGFLARMYTIDKEAVMVRPPGPRLPAYPRLRRPLPKPSSLP